MASTQKQVIATVNGVEKSSGANGLEQGDYLAAQVNGTMSKHQTERIGPLNAVESVSTTSLCESSRQFMSTMLADEIDFASESSTRSFQQTPECAKSSSHESENPAEQSFCPLKRSPGTVRIVEFTSQTKSFVSAVVSTSSTRSLLQTSTTNDITQFGNVSEIDVKVINGADTQKRPSRSLSTLSNSSQGSTICKSFVQQRIERLYGPGALAQGFFSRTRQTLHQDQDEIEPQAQESTSTNLSVSNHALPVLRHLRPEFRAQLPLTPTTVTRSHRHLQCEVATSASEFQITQPVLQQQTSVESLSDSQPAAPDVPILAVETGSLTSGNKPGDSITSVLSQDTFPTTTTVSTSEAVLKDTDNLCTPKDETSTTGPLCYEICDEINDSEKDGHYFLKVLRSEIQRLMAMVESAERELNEASRLPEEAQGKLRAASGQARLLMKQKLQQFEGLCHKNINQSPDEVFPTTSQDLAGFWDMVKLQIDHVDRSFIEIDQLRKAGWVEICSDAQSTKCANTGSGVRRRPNSRRSNLNSSSGNRTKGMSEDRKKESEMARKSREEQSQNRKRIIEERRRLLQQQQYNQQQRVAAKQENIEIFVPHENGK